MTGVFRARMYYDVGQPLDQLSSSPVIASSHRESDLDMVRDWNVVEVHGHVVPVTEHDCYCWWLVRALHQFFFRWAGFMRGLP
ncbi:hypothetical protein C1924_02220 [Stenotrophomonas sp. ESTM1D_MKCIP4_1]|nr:hypothetical protein C1924_02220 [Stenotrophomonas sp. ESTM1D_MKCIP4_1]